jgi:hypothetical protein
MKKFFMKIIVFENFENEASLLGLMDITTGGRCSISFSHGDSMGGHLGTEERMDAKVAI